LDVGPGYFGNGGLGNGGLGDNSEFNFPNGNQKGKTKSGKTGGQSPYKKGYKLGYDSAKALVDLAALAGEPIPREDRNELMQRAEDFKQLCAIILHSGEIVRFPTLSNMPEAQARNDVVLFARALGWYRLRPRTEYSWHTDSFHIPFRFTSSPRLAQKNECKAATFEAIQRQFFIKRQTTNDHPPKGGCQGDEMKYIFILPLL